MAERGLPISRIFLRNFRSYAQFERDFSASGTLLTGVNGSGKTNLLEAIGFLSILRSFRTVSGREMIRLGEREFEISATVGKSCFTEELRVLQHADGGRETFIGPNRIRSFNDFTREFRAVVFIPEDRNIPGGSSGCRRRFFDMLISVLDRDYLNDLASYMRALSQRNRALKSGEKQLKVIAAFEPELAVAAPRISAARRAYAERVAKEVNLLLRNHHSNLKFEISYRPDFPESPEKYLEMLQRNRHLELHRGFTRSGPQLDEFELLLNGKLIRSYASTGQMRLIALLLKMAEFNLVRCHCNEKVVVLADDVTGELDEYNRDRFLEVISEADQQFFTFTSRPDFQKLANFDEIKIDKL